MALFKVLTGLPPYGPTAKPFPASGHGAFREGFVVQFESHELGTWVGNFQPGCTDFSGAYEHPDGKHAVIVSGGAIYIVDPEIQTTEEFGNGVSSVMQVNMNALLFNEDTNLSFIGPNGNWKTKRLSWDGICDLSISGDSVLGKGWRYDDTWHTFTVSLANGSHAGGAYDESEFRPIKSAWWQFWRKHA
jgi:hypothetical protein